MDYVFHHSHSSSALPKNNSVVAFCNRLAFCIISVSEEMGEVVLEPLVDLEEAIC